MRIVLLHGRDRYLMRERSRQLAHALEEVHGTLQRFEFDGDSTDLATLLDELRSYGLLAPHKLVVLNRAEQFLSGNESRRRALEAYARAPLDHATLLLRAETWRPGKLDDLVRAAGGVFKVEPVNGATAVRWCQERCRKRWGVALEPHAAAALVDRVGTDLDHLDSELGKLAAFVGEGRAVTMDDVGRMVGLSREEQAWSIQAAVLSGSTSEAMHSLRELLTVSRHPEQPIAWAVSDLVRKLHTASRLLHQGAPPATVARELRLFPPARDQVLRLARAHEPDHLAHLLRDALESDRRTKSGVGDSVRSLEALVVRVTDSVRAPGAP
jgi:DNA polymerase-3 subunit delta